MTTDADLGLDDMQEIIGDFLVEADELTEILDNGFVKLESSPGDVDLLNEIFRAVHTIKGTSSFLGFEQVTILSHKMEDVLNRMRKGEMSVTPRVMDCLLEALDNLKLMLGNVRNSVSEEVNLEPVLERLTLLERGEVTENRLPGGDAVPASTDQVPLAEPPRPALSEDPQSAAKAKTATTDKQVTNAEQTIRVDIDRLDHILNMMGELVLGRNSLLQSLGDLTAEHPGDFRLDSLKQAAKSVNFVTTELQMAVMKMRMQPVSKVFNRLPRQVRDLSRELGKKIDLRISGETTEVDKAVIEEIGDPLMHIIRNACDHGIETAKERVAAGKPAAGTITLSAAQEGSNIVIVVEDDGRGFDLEAIRRKAVDRSFVTAEDAEHLSDGELSQFVFHAGFSTARVVTDVSGRGVGMDVVHTNIRKLNGSIELESTAGVGSTVHIKLPLTLAIIQGLMTECDGEVFILPLSSVCETVKAEQAGISYINRRPVLRLRDEVIPIVNLVEVLGGGRGGFVLAEKPYIVVVGLADRKLGLLSDRLLGQEEVVIKSLGDYLGSAEGIAGATILGDGRVRLIVDLIGLFKKAESLRT